MILVSFIILSIYGVLMVALSIGFVKVKEFNTIVKIHTTQFSIIIPFRNEENNLTELLNSLALLDYPEEDFEILMVNDDSDDNSLQCIQHFKTKHPSLPIIILKNLRKSASPKKDAIECAIDKAQFDWIITTDADCVVPTTWLNAHDAFIQEHQPKMIAAPVTYSVGNTILEQFQLFDFLSLQAATIGGFGLKEPFLCNGANLCYQKSAFIEVNGFEGNEHIASGDDVFLLEKMTQAFQDQVRFLKSKDAIVYTKPQPTFKSLISQRVRWAAKTTSVKSAFTKLVGITILLMNFLLIFALFLFLTGFFNGYLVLFIFIIKFILDSVLLKKSFRFFGRSFHFLTYLSNSLCYPFFSTYVAVLSLFKSYNWKERSFKK